jgi:hypothetical protein
VGRKSAYFGELRIGLGARETSNFSPSVETCVYSPIQVSKPENRDYVTLCCVFHGEPDLQRDLVMLHFAVSDVA